MAVSIALFPQCLQGETYHYLDPGRLGLMTILALAALLVWQRVTGSRSARHLLRAATVLCIRQPD